VTRDNPFDKLDVLCFSSFRFQGEVLMRLSDSELLLCLKAVRERVRVLQANLDRPHRGEEAKALAVRMRGMEDAYQLLWEKLDAERHRRVNNGGPSALLLTD
jgi:hypothetical protein